MKMEQTTLHDMYAQANNNSSMSNSSCLSVSTYLLKPVAEQKSDNCDCLLFWIEKESFRQKI